jgi:SPP1 gp7 family putative phage head morphogenesis protein
VYLSENGGDFIDNLPDSTHYADKGVRGLSKQLWNLYSELYRDEYETLISGIENVELSEHDPVELADYGRKARLIINKLKSSDRWAGALDRTADIFQKIMKKAARLELGRANLSAKVDESELNEWVQQHLAEFAAQVQSTTRSEIRDFVAAKLSDGKELPEIVQAAREHFSEFPQWKADRLVRTEVRDVYNNGTLLAAQAAGVKKVQAADGSGGDTDPECAERDGRVYDLSDALNEREHPNGTLSWRIIPATNFSIQRYERDDDQPRAHYETSTQTVYLSDDLSRDEEREYLKAVVEAL